LITVTLSQKMVQGHFTQSNWQTCRCWHLHGSTDSRL